MKWAVELVRFDAGEEVLKRALRRFRVEIHTVCGKRALWWPALERCEDRNAVSGAALGLQGLMNFTNANQHCTFGAYMEKTADGWISHPLVNVTANFVSEPASLATDVDGPLFDGTTEEREAAIAAAKEREWTKLAEWVNARIEACLTEPRCAEVLELLDRTEHDGKSLWGMWELMVSVRDKDTKKAFLKRFGVDEYEFACFGKGVHDPRKNGVEFARHRVETPPPKNFGKPIEAMNQRQCQDFIFGLARRWVESLAKVTGPKTGAGK